MLQWKQSANGTTALLIEGARRIGKSTVVRQFAKEEYKSHLLIDFNEASPRVIGLFDDLMNLDLLFLQLQNIYGVVLHPRQSVIIFDEVQQCPRARQAIKYLVKDGRYDYIETGSLISIRKNTKNITIPSEEERLDMYPMDYEEFRWALGDEASCTLTKQCFEQRIPLRLAHRDKLRDLRLYMLIGGMPQAVDKYLQTNNFSEVDRVKRTIIKLYQDDFNKIDNTGRLALLFTSIPGQLSRNVARYYTQAVIGRKNEAARQQLLSELIDSRTVLAAYHVDDPNVGMPLTQNLSRYKLFLADTGLFVTLAFWDKDFTENTIYSKLLSDKLEANLGYVYENLVAQMLVAAGNKLFYHTFPKDDKHLYEIDFLLSRDNKLCPLEVKSSGYKQHASLDAFCKKYSSRLGTPYLITPKDYDPHTLPISLPFYMLPYL